MVPGGTVAPVKKVDQIANPAQSKDRYSSYGIGWPSKQDKTFEQLFGNLNLGTFNSE